MHSGQTVVRIKMKLGMQVGLGPGHIVLDGTQLPLPQRGTAPQFSDHICCYRTAGWIKMPLGIEVDLGPGNFVLDGDPAAPSPKRGGASQFSAHVYCGHGRPSQLLLSSCFTYLPIVMAPRHRGAEHDYMYCLQALCQTQTRVLC